MCAATRRATERACSPIVALCRIGTSSRRHGRRPRGRGAPNHACLPLRRPLAGCLLDLPAFLSESLEVLCLNDNHLDAVPPSLCLLKNLSELYLGKYVDRGERPHGALGPGRRSVPRKPAEDTGAGGAQGPSPSRDAAVRVSERGAGGEGGGDGAGTPPTPLRSVTRAAKTLPPVC